MRIEYCMETEKRPILKEVRWLRGSKNFISKRDSMEHVQYLLTYAALSYACPPTLIISLTKSWPKKQFIPLFHSCSTEMSRVSQMVFHRSRRLSVKNFVRILWGLHPEYYIMSQKKTCTFSDYNSCVPRLIPIFIIFELLGIGIVVSRVIIDQL